MKTTLAASDPQAKQRNALALVQSLTPAVKQPSKPFVHLCAARIGSTSFVALNLAAARFALDAFKEAGYVVTFAVYMHGDKLREMVPLLVQDKASPA